MSHYQRLLAAAVQSITGATAEQGVASLFSPGGTTIDQHSFKAIDDFEVISYLILVDSTN
jgi:AICAR transformylase/IMP cyclohydrolase PurH